MNKVIKLKLGVDAFHSNDKTVCLFWWSNSLLVSDPDHATRSCVFIMMRINILIMNMNVCTQSWMPYLFKYVHSVAIKTGT